MAMPRKGRRSVVVDATRYFYRITFGSDRMVIQAADGGAFIFVFPFAILTPVNVAAAIRFAISRGWAPGKKGADCWLAFDVDANGEPHFEYVPLDDFRVVTYSTMGKIDGSGPADRFSDTRPWYARPSPADRMTT